MRAYGGLGALAVSSMLEAATPRDALAPKPPHHKATAKSVIWLVMEGGPSHLDLFGSEAGVDANERAANARVVWQADHGDGHGVEHPHGLHAEVQTIRSGPKREPPRKIQLRLRSAGPPSPP